MNFVKTFRTLLENASPSGFEAHGAKAIADLAAPYCDKVKIDALGNVICRKKGPGKRIMVAAHMDVIGFMVNRFEKDGFLQVTNIGGHQASRLSGKKVRFLNGASGVLFERSDAELKTKTGDKAAMTDLFLDIGATSEEEARKMVRVGDVAVFDYEAKEIGDGLLMSPYCDNLASCAAMLCAMSQVKKTENDLYFVFTVQEEQGLKGSKTSAHAIEPDLGLAIDLTHAGDCPGAADGEVKLGGGPAIKVKDASLICTPEAVEHLRKSAEENGISYQDEVLLRGGTDTASILVSRDGVPSGCVSIPGRYIHSTAETISIHDGEQAAALLARACEREL